MAVELARLRKAWSRWHYVTCPVCYAYFKWRDRMQCAGFRRYYRWPDRGSDEIQPCRPCWHKVHGWAPGVASDVYQEILDV